MKHQVAKIMQLATGICWRWQLCSVTTRSDWLQHDS